MSMPPRLLVKDNSFSGGRVHNGDSFVDSNITYKTYNCNHSPSSATSGTTSCGPFVDQAELNFQLLEAAKTGQHIKVNKYLEKGADLDFVDEDGSNALHHAVASGSRKTSAGLIERGIELDAVSRRYGSPMLTAILRNDSDLVGLLEESRCRKDLDDLGTAFHAACYKGNEMILRMLKPVSVDARLQATVNLSAWRRIGKGITSSESSLDDEIVYEVTPNMLAARKGRIGVLQLLTRGRSMSTDSMTSMESQRKATAKYTKSKGWVDLGRLPDLGDVDNTGRTAVMYAAEFGRPECVKFLIDEGSALNDTTTTGESALSLALSGSDVGHDDSACILLKAGACAGYRDKKGNTLLHLAVQNDHDEALSKLAKRYKVSNDLLNKKSRSRKPKGAKHASRKVTMPKHCKNETNVLDAINEDGDTALLLAAKLGSTDCVRHLIEAGAFIDQTDADDWTPLIAAASKNHVGAVETLLDHGADALAQTGGGQTAMHKAAEGGHIAVLQAMIKRKHLGVVRVLNAVDHFRRTPLHTAVASRRTECVEALLRAGAKPGGRDRDHQTPWDIADARNDYAILKLLNEVIPDPVEAINDEGSKASLFEKSWNFMQGKGFVGGLGSQYGIGSPTADIKRPFTAVPAMETAITAVKLRRTSSGLLFRVESSQSTALSSSQLTEIFQMEL